MPSARCLLQHGIRRLRHPRIRHPHIPLIAQVRLHDRLAAVAVLDAVPRGLAALKQAFCPHSSRLELLHHLRPRLLPGQAHQQVRIAHVCPPVLIAHAPVGPHHVHHRQTMPLADLIVVGIVRRRHLQESRRHLGLGVVLLFIVPRIPLGQHHVAVLDDRNHAAHQRQLDKQPTQRGGPRIVRIDRHGGIAQVCLGPRGCDRNPGLLVRRVVIRAGIPARGEFIPCHGLGIDLVGVALARASPGRARLERERVHERVPQVVKVAVDFFVVALVVGDGGLQDRVPVDEALAAVDQAGPEQAEERLAHRRRTLLVHREPLAIPVTRTAHLLKLARDHRLILVLERLNLGDKLITLEVAAALLLFLHHALLDHRLRRNAGVVGARHPQGLVPAHAMGPHQDVLDRVVEGVAEVQRRRDVGRRDEHGVGLGMITQHPLRVGEKRLRGDPLVPDAILVLAGLVGLGQLGEIGRCLGHSVHRRERRNHHGGPRRAAEGRRRRRGAADLRGIVQIGYKDLA